MSSSNPHAAMVTTNAIVVFLSTLAAHTRPQRHTRVALHRHRHTICSHRHVDVQTTQPDCISCTSPLLACLLSFDACMLMIGQGWLLVAYQSKTNPTCTCLCIDPASVIRSWSPTTNAGKGMCPLNLLLIELVVENFCGREKHRWYKLAMMFLFTLCSRSFGFTVSLGMSYI